MPGAVRLEDDTLDLEGPGYLDESRIDERADVSGLAPEVGEGEAAGAGEEGWEGDGEPQEAEEEGEEGEPHEIEEVEEVRGVCVSSMVIYVYNIYIL